MTSFRIDLFDFLAVHGGTEESSPTPQFKSISSSVLSYLYGPTLISIHDWVYKQELRAITFEQHQHNAEGLARDP